MTETLRERMRERLIAVLSSHIAVIADHETGSFEIEAHAAELADAILREFRLQPVAQGVVGEDGEVTLSPVPRL